MSKRKQVTIPIEKIQEQDKYIEQIHRQNEEYFNRTGKRKLVFTQTFGCQMNEHDSEKLCSMLEEMGYQMSMMVEESDLIIYNTCAIKTSKRKKSRYENSCMWMYDATTTCCRGIKKKI